MITEIKIPNIGIDTAEVTEILVHVGDNIQVNQSVIVIEGNKTSIEIPSLVSGIVKKINAKVGDVVQTNSVIMEIEIKDSKNYTEKKIEYQKQKNKKTCLEKDKKIIYIRTSPYVRKILREYKIDLESIRHLGSGKNGRIFLKDIYQYIENKKIVKKSEKNDSIQIKKLYKHSEKHSNMNFSVFGEIEEIDLNHIQKVSGKNLHRNWNAIPHVTQFEEVDVTELESFRKSYNHQVTDVEKITLLPFVIKIVSKTLEKFPYFNSSLSIDGKKIILKKYINIGIAVNTKSGLLVPVIKDVNKKNVLDLSYELKQIINKSKCESLQLSDMQGGCFTISNLGNIGGSTFTPIINAPEVAILGISKTIIKPYWDGNKFIPKLFLPLSLSYDHRVINGVDGAMFIKNIEKFISDIRFLII